MDFGSWTLYWFLSLTLFMPSGSEVLLSLRFYRWVLMRNPTCGITCQKCLSCVDQPNNQLTLNVFLQKTNHERYWTWQPVPPDSLGDLEGNPSFLNPLVISMSEAEDATIWAGVESGGRLGATCMFETQLKVDIQEILRLRPQPLIATVTGNCYKLNVTMSASCGANFQGDLCDEPLVKTTTPNASLAVLQKHNLSESYLVRRYRSWLLISVVLLGLCVLGLLFIGCLCGFMKLKEKKERRRHTGRIPENGTAHTNGGKCPKSPRRDRRSSKTKKTEDLSKNEALLKDLIDEPPEKTNGHNFYT